MVLMIHVSLAFCIYSASLLLLLLLLLLLHNNLSIHYSIQQIFPRFTDTFHSHQTLILLRPSSLPSLIPILNQQPTCTATSIMRSFRSFPINPRALSFLFLLIIILVTTDSRSNPSWVVRFPSRNQEYYYISHPQRQQRHSLLDTCRPSSRSQLCDHLEMIHGHQRPFPPPPAPRSTKDSDYEIDPRYGVEKRLVPSGPNPLHN